MRHEWVCTDCGWDSPFKQPELPPDDPHSECNQDRRCSVCGAEMYFERVDEKTPLINEEAGEAKL